MLGVVHFMQNNQGMTLIESLLSFSIFVTVIVLILSIYSQVLNHYQNCNDNYQEYIKLQNEKELNLWQANDLHTSINEVLH